MGWARRKTAFDGTQLHSSAGQRAGAVARLQKTLVLILALKATNRYGGDAYARAQTSCSTTQTRKRT